MSGNCKPPLLFSHIIVLYFTRCAPLSEQQRYGLKICENELLLLGVYIGKNQSQCNELNWRGKINKIKALLNMWLQRKLTIQGRVNVISSLFMSRLWYTLFVTSMPDWAITEIKNICVQLYILCQWALFLIYFY
jgi:hypothetical protein